MYVCMYVCIECISQAQEYITNAILWKIYIIKLSQSYSTNEVRFSFLLRDSSSYLASWCTSEFAFLGILFWGERTYKVLLMFAKESHMRALILCPTHRSLFFGVNLWGIASCSSLCALLISKVQIRSVIALYVYYSFYGRGFHIYIFSYYIHNF